MQASVDSTLTPADAAPVGAHPWVPDQGDGTYCNPVLFADYSDPDAVRQGDDYYLVASSFNCTPGLPILHSRDLVNWTLINHAVKNLPHPRYAEVQPGCGVWAPAIRHHAGKFWIFFPMPDEGIYVTTAVHPADEWSEPHLVQAGKGLIDPCPLWDDDGQAWLVHAYAGSRAGIKHRLRVCPMAPDASRLLGEGKIVYHEPEKQPTLEGPKFLKRDGWYYILAPAGGVETGWQLALRSRHIYGPYEDRITLAQGRTAINGPHQGALVDTAAGEWWFLHFQDADVYGRIVHLQPVTWQDGWPLAGQLRAGSLAGEPVLHHAKPKVAADEKILVPATDDEFDTPKLGLQWQWQANHGGDWYSLVARPGWLRLYPQPAHPQSAGRNPHLLLQKFPARTFTVETSLELSASHPGEEAGLVVAGRSQAELGLRQEAQGWRIILRVDGLEQFSQAVEAAAVRLQLEVRSGGECHFGFEVNGETVSVPITFQAQKGVWIGAKVGVYCHQSPAASPAGHADFDWFRFGAGEVS